MFQFRPFVDCSDPCTLEDFEAMVGPYLVSSDEELAQLCADTLQTRNKNTKGKELSRTGLTTYANLNG